MLGVDRSGPAPGACSSRSWSRGLHIIGRQLPVPIRGIDSDNDSVFINETLVQHCADSGIEFTRSRAYRKNDQTWIEQKNGAVIRRFVGHDRYTGQIAGQTLAHLYGAVRLYVNYFQPSFKLVEKTRDGARVTKRYDKPATPCDRLLEHGSVSVEIKDRLRENRTRLDPVALLHTIRQAQSALVAVASPEGQAAPSQEGLEHFLSQLPDLWRLGEVRPTHAQRDARPRTCEPGRIPLEGSGLTSCSGCSRNRTLPPRPSWNACGLSTLAASPTASSGHCNAEFANGGESWLRSSSMPLLTSRCRGTLQQGRSLRLELTPEAQISVTFPDEATRPAKVIVVDQRRLRPTANLDWTSRTLTRTLAGGIL